MLPWAVDFSTGDFSQFNYDQFGAGFTIESDGTAYPGLANYARTALPGTDGYEYHIIGPPTNAGPLLTEWWFEVAISYGDFAGDWPVSHKCVLFNLTDGVGTNRRYQVMLYAGDQAWTGQAAGEWAFELIEWSPAGAFVRSALLLPNLGQRAPINRGQWDVIRGFVRLNTTWDGTPALGSGPGNGIMQCWLNGTQVMDYSDVCYVRDEYQCGLGRTIMTEDQGPSWPVGTPTTKDFGFLEVADNSADLTAMPSGPVARSASGGADYDHIAAPFAVTMTQPGDVYELDMQSATPLNDLGIGIGAGLGNPVTDLGGGVYTGDNGGRITYGESSGWGGAPGLKVEPPTINPGGGDAGYVTILSGLDPVNGAETLNIGYMLYIEPNWAASNQPNNGPKYIWPFSELGADNGNARFGNFLQHNATWMPADSMAFSATFGTLQNYARVGAGMKYSVDDGSAPIGLIIGSAPNHTGAGVRDNTPVIGGEWVYFEHAWSFGANAYNELHVYTSDGVLSGKMLEIDSTLDTGLAPTPSTFGYIQIIGGYWNQAIIQRVANGGVIYSRPRITYGLPRGTVIGPPSGFGA
jgi:hypothetical protein